MNPKLANPKLAICTLSLVCPKPHGYMHTQIRIKGLMNIGYGVDAAEEDDCPSHLNKYWGLSFIVCTTLASGESARVRTRRGNINNAIWHCIKCQTDNSEIAVQVQENISAVPPNNLADFPCRSSQGPFFRILFFKHLPI